MDSMINIHLTEWHMNASVKQTIVGLVNDLALAQCQATT